MRAHLCMYRPHHLFAYNINTEGVKKTNTAGKILQRSVGLREGSRQAAATTFFTFEKKI